MSEFASKKFTGGIGTVSAKEWTRESQNKTGHELIIVEAGSWVHGSSLYYSVYF